MLAMRSLQIENGPLVAGRGGEVVGTVDFNRVRPRRNSADNNSSDTPASTTSEQQNTTVGLLLQLRSHARKRRDRNEANYAKPGGRERESIRLEPGQCPTSRWSEQSHRPATALQDELDSVQIGLRAGHTGEIEVRGDDVSGIAVHLAARVMAEADPGEILVSRTVRDLVVGSDISFTDRGTHQLKGIEGDWQLYSAI
jgi:hypothetical protein